MPWRPSSQHKQAASILSLRGDGNNSHGVTRLQAASVAINYTKKTEIEKAVIPVETLMGKITKVKRGGRRITVVGGGKTQKVRVSGRKTAIMVSGQKAKRKALKIGMNCALTHQGSAAKKFDCK